MYCVSNNLSQCKYSVTVLEILNIFNLHHHVMSQSVYCSVLQLQQLLTHLVLARHCQCTVPVSDCYSTVVQCLRVSTCQNDQVVNVQSNAFFSGNLRFSGYQAENDGKDKDLLLYPTSEFYAGCDGKMLTAQYKQYLYYHQGLHGMCRRGQMKARAVPREAALRPLH